MKTLVAVQRQIMVDMVNEAHWSPDKDISDLVDIQSRAKDLATKVFQDGDWPDDLYPMPQLFGRLAHGYKEKAVAYGYGERGLLAEALKLFLKATLLPSQRAGTVWVHRIFELLQIFTPIMVAEKHDLPKFPLPKGLDLWSIFYGYLSDLDASSLRVYGPDTTYSKAIQKWYGQGLADSDPRIGTLAFLKRFESGQAKLLK
jgi:hypothetical protein